MATAFQFAQLLDRIQSLPNYPGFPGLGCPTTWCINPNRLWNIFMYPELCYAELCELYSEKIAVRVLTDYFKQKLNTIEEQKQFIKDHFELKIAEVFMLWYNTHFSPKENYN